MKGEEGGIGTSVVDSSLNATVVEGDASEAVATTLVASRVR